MAGCACHRLVRCIDRARWSLTAHSGRAGDAGTVRIANVHAGAENCTVVNLASFAEVLSTAKLRFPQVFMGFPRVFWKLCELRLIFSRKRAFWAQRKTEILRCAQNDRSVVEAEERAFAQRCGQRSVQKVHDWRGCFESREDLFLQRRFVAASASSVAENPHCRGSSRSIAG